MTTSALKNIALNEKHISLGAKMVPFAGYNMPLQYSNLIQEHLCVRNNVGIFDVSHMGEFIVKGEGALNLLQWVTSNDVSKLEDGKIQYSCLPNSNGGIVDDLLVYRKSENEYLLVVNASNIEKDWEWINSQNTFGATLEDISDSLSLFAVQGPKAIEMLQKLTDEDLNSIPYYSFKEGKLAGVEMIISNTGYTGAGGFELYVENSKAIQVFEAIMKTGKEYEMLPCGLGCRDTLRMEKGFCLYGNDINDNTSPIEAGLGWITKFTKDFVNKEFHLNLKNSGVSKKLVGFEMIERGIPRHDYEIKDENGNKIGIVTSGTQSPSLQKAIGMGYVDINHSMLGNTIYIDIRNNRIKAKVVKMPFL